MIARRPSDAKCKSSLRFVGYTCADLGNIGIIGLQFLLLLGTILILATFNQGIEVIPTQDEIMAEIDKEAEEINEIMNNKIENHP